MWRPIHPPDWDDDEAQAEPHKSIAQEAEDIVEERGNHYGHPQDNHHCTALLWTAYLERRYGEACGAIDAEDVCWLNILQKISRQAHVRKRDNVLDVMGFAINIDMLD